MSKHLIYNDLIGTSLIPPRISNFGMIDVKFFILILKPKRSFIDMEGEEKI